jgi:hypothetical protein
MRRVSTLAHLSVIILKKSVPNTPLRPHILAAFLPWGGFAGAGRPARRKGSVFTTKKTRIFRI